MVGWAKTFTLAVTKRVLPSPYLRSKMETALGASPKPSGNLKITSAVNLLKIMMPFYSIYLASDSSKLPKAKEAYAVAALSDLFSIELCISMS